MHGCTLRSRICIAVHAHAAKEREIGQILSASEDNPPFDLKKSVNRAKNIVKNVVFTLTWMENCGSIVDEKKSGRKVIRMRRIIKKSS